MSTLRSRVIRLAHEKPELRPHLLPLLKEAMLGKHSLGSKSGGQRNLLPKSYKGVSFSEVWTDVSDAADKAMLRLNGSPIVNEERPKAGDPKLVTDQLTRLLSKAKGVERAAIQHFIEEVGKIKV